MAPKWELELGMGSILPGRRGGWKNRLPVVPFLSLGKNGNASSHLPQTEVLTHTPWSMEA